MAYGAYQKTQQAAANPIQVEADALGRVTHQIEALQQNGGPEYVKALYRNVQLWNAFSVDLVSPENRLPDALKASLISLSLWVEKHTAKVVAGTASVTALIDVNRSIIAGLSQAFRTPTAPAAAPAAFAAKLA